MVSKQNVFQQKKNCSGSIYMKFLMVEAKHLGFRVSFLSAVELGSGLSLPQQQHCYSRPLRARPARLSVSSTNSKQSLL